MELSSSVASTKTAMSQDGYIGSTPILAADASVHTGDISNAPLDTAPVDVSVGSVDTSAGSTTATMRSGPVPKESVL